MVRDVGGLRLSPAHDDETVLNGAPVQKRYYDFNVFTSGKIEEKLRYMHRNPVVQGFGREAGGLGIGQRIVAI